MNGWVVRNKNARVVRQCHFPPDLPNTGTLFGDRAANGQEGHAQGGATGLQALGLQPQPRGRRPRPGRDHEAHSEGGTRHVVQHLFTVYTSTNLLKI